MLKQSRGWIKDWKMMLMMLDMLVVEMLLLLVMRRCQ